MEQTVALIDFFEKEFIIPHYQRGFRWEQQEIEELLDDLWNFEKTSNKGEFYCLQPIVLQQIGDNTYHVLDGQQRLTTLFLILVFLDEIRNDAGYSQPLFTLNYETRGDCQIFLEEKKFINGIDETNIDYYHITLAYQTIKAWFANTAHAGAKMKLVPVLMDKNDKGNRNVRFIWYEVESDSNPIEIFIRLNVGKIPLTDAELMKALLLQRDKYDAEELKFIELRLFEIATEWDNIEYSLQREEFWYFISNQSNNKPTHIEFLLDLFADTLQREKKYYEKKPLKHATFLILAQYLQDLIDNKSYSRIEAVENIWEQVSEYFEHFNDWFQNRSLFHYIGFLISINGNQLIDMFISQSKKLSKKQFKKYLESEIGKLVVVKKTRKDSDGKEYAVILENLNYENEDQRTHDKTEIHRILLLHNVYTSLNSDKEKASFPFNLYKQTKKNEKWSLEHIHAQNSQHIIKLENQRTWLTDHLKSLSNQDNPNFEELIKRMNKIYNDAEIEKEEFETLVNDVHSEIYKITDTDQKGMHSIGNLCLVDTYTNSQLNNSVFDVKREKIKAREFKGYYIPICTRNVFMKAFTSYPINNAYWTSDDRKGYLINLRYMYDHFVNAIEEN